MVYVVVGWIFIARIKDKKDKIENVKIKVSIIDIMLIGWFGVREMK
jgi:hypothetical protein